MASLSSSAIVSTKSAQRQQYKRSVSFDDQCKNNEKPANRLSYATTSRPPVPTTSSQVQVPKERRRSFLGRRDSSKRLSKNLNSNLLFSTSTITPSSSDYVKKDRQPTSTSRSARHSIASVPMAYVKGTVNPGSPQISAPPQLQLRTNIEAPEDQASICHSPTWADEKSKKKTSGWGWRKPSQPKQKKEEETEQIIKPGRKLNKKPPPAMETQRHIATLKNGSTSSESLQSERRPSSSGSLTQAMRGFLSRRSSQTNSPDVSRPPSATGMRSQSQERPKTQDRTSRRTSRDTKYEEDEAYANDIAAFVNQMEASARAVVETPSPKPNALVQPTTFPAPLHTPPRSRGQESPLPPTPAIQSSPASRSTSVPASISRIFGKKDNAAGGYKYPGLNKKQIDGGSFEGDKSNSNTWLNRGSGAKSLTSANATKPETTSGGGYVQRQRMVQQQRSIMGFRDEMAVKSAYDQFITESQLPPTPKDSTESVHPDQVKPEVQAQPQSRVDARFKEQRQPEPSKQQLPLAAWKPPTPPAKPVLQTRATQSPDRRPLPATPVTANETKAPILKESYQGVPRPAPVAIQSSNIEVQNHSLPNIAQYNRAQPIEASRQSKDSMTTLTSTSTGTSGSSTLSQKISPVYQLPAITPAETSPIFSKFPEHFSEGTSPPTSNLNDNSVRPMPTNPRKDAQLPPLPPTAISKPVHKNEYLVATENAEGIIRKTSMKRHRSDPELKVEPLKTDLPSLDFLPELRHQAFTKPKRSSRTTTTPGSPTHPPLSPSQFPIPSTSTELTKRSGGQVRSSKRTTIVGNVALTGGAGMPPKPIAKLFVICCQCKFWHDLPSKIYEAMALPQAVSREDNIAGGVHHGAENGQGALPDGEVKGFQGKIFTQVKCPWCPHCLSTSCCQGWTAITYLHERHH